MIARTFQDNARAALQALRTGVATTADWRALHRALGLAQHLSDQATIPGMGGHLGAADDALHYAQRRAGHVHLAELEALDTALDLLALLVNQAPREARVFIEATSVQASACVAIHLYPRQQFQEALQL